MPLFQYFSWVGGFLFAALFAANWCVSAPIVPAPRSDVPLDQRINIRIHTDHKWPERVVFDTTRSTLAPEANDDPEADIGGSKTPAQAERQPFDAFAEMAVVSVTRCFRPPCYAGQVAERETSPTEKGVQSRNGSRITARKGLTFPNPPHKPQERS
jgi:hypothetical protein